MAFTYKILNDYQAGSLNGKTFRLGTDYSFDYVDNKGIMLYIYDEYLDSTVSFKTFLKDFTIGFDVKPGDEKAVDGGKIRTIDNFSITYNFGLDIPSPSVNDARVNAGRMEELDRMLSNNFILTNGVVREAERIRFALLSNLVSNGKYKKKHEIKSGSDVKKYGVPFYMSSFGYEIDLEMGFFDYNGQLFPKTYTTTFTLAAQAGKIHNGTYLIAGFEGNNTYYDKDVRSWPFGVE